MDAIGRTALLTAAERARESGRSDRLFDDPLATVLAGEEGAALLESAPPGSTSRVMSIRTRFFDDWVLGLAGRNVRQVVVVAAGMDTRAFRLAWPPATILWELDRPDLLGIKQDLLRGAGAEAACDRRQVAVDLGADSWPDALSEAGFRPHLPSAWLVEGLLVYLGSEQVTHLLGQIADLASGQGRLGVDFVSESFLRSPWMRSYLEWLAAQEAPWRFGTDRPEDVLAASGWHATAVTQPGEEGAGAGLLPWPVMPREVPNIPRSFLVTAAPA